MKLLGICAAGAAALLLTGGILAKSAEARVFKGGSSQRVGVVNPADPGPIVVPGTSGGGKSGGGGSAGRGGGKSK